MLRLGSNIEKLNTETEYNLYLEVLDGNLKATESRNRINRGKLCKIGQKQRTGVLKQMSQTLPGKSQFRTCLASTCSRMF